MYNLQRQVDLKPIITTMSRSSQSQVKPFCAVCKDAGKSASEYTSHYYKDHFIPGAAKPFCPVCKNAGKSEKEYTSHYTRSSPGPTGVVVCPTILQATCSYCRKVGHFKNKCPVLLEKERSLQKVVTPQLPGVEKKVGVPNHKNRFATLDSDEDSDDNETVDAIALLGPKPVVAVAAVTIPNKMSYASVLSAPVAVPKPVVPVALVAVAPVVAPLAAVAVPNHVKKTTVMKGFSKCWADYYSSDEED